MREGRPSRTAQYVAQVRAILHRQGVIDDPYARDLLTRPNAVVASVIGAVPRVVSRSSFLSALAARITFFDEQVVDALDAGMDHVVIVGAGYDSRAWRFARPGVQFHELDHPVTQADKRRRAPAGGPRYVPVDLAVRPVLDALGDQDFPPDRPALFVVEGVTMYLSEAEVRSLLTGLAAGAAPGSRLAVNFAAPPDAGSALVRTRQRALRVVGAAGGERHQFFLHARDTAAFVAGTGWPVVEAVTLSAVAVRALAATRLRTDRLTAAAGAVAARLDG